LLAADEVEQTVVVKVTTLDVEHEVVAAAEVVGAAALELTYGAAEETGADETGAAEEVAGAAEVAGAEVAGAEVATAEVGGAAPPVGMVTPTDWQSW